MKKKKGVFNQFSGCCRTEILKYCEEQHIAENQFRPLSINKWRDVYEKVVENFRDRSESYRQGLHWLNTNGAFQKDKQVVYAFDSREASDWVKRLPSLIDGADEMAYLLIEEGDKFWIFEGNLECIARILYEGFYLDDYYIADRKYRWMITCNHHMVILFVGEGFRMEEVKKLRRLPESKKPMQPF